MDTEKIWDEYSNKLFLFIKSEVTKIDAIDILQDVFIKMHSKIDRLKDTAKIEPWV